MRWIPTKFALWTPSESLSPFIAAISLAGGLTFAGLARASEVGTAMSAEPVTGHWPWIAAVAIVGLLGVVSFASRRRMHAVVGS